MIQIREATVTDVGAVVDFFSETIRSVNSIDYSEEQIKVWASARNLHIWREKVTIQCFILAEIADSIVGFASLESSGYLDFMYVHKDHQRQGIARKLLRTLEERAQAWNLDRMWALVSLTAKPFFQSQGFEVTDLEEKTVAGVGFTNFRMEKSLR